MEIVTIKISKELLQMLIDSDVITTDDYEVKNVNDDSFDYSKDEEWLELSKVAAKSYKKKKELEYLIRQRK
tara:strand:+ start:1983 stop:2195 length:213 start_codon:yes stop_codon:yes gene_type:complete